MIGRDGTREEVVQKYKEWIMTQSELLKDIDELEDKTLGCWCAPAACHGDVLAQLATINKIMREEDKLLEKLGNTNE